MKTDIRARIADRADSDRVSGRWPELRVCWQHGKAEARIALDIDSEERAVCFSIAVPLLFSYFFTLSGLPAVLFPRRLFAAFGRGKYLHQGTHRSIGVRFFDWAAWLSIWEDTHETHHDDPWWMKGRIGLDDFADILFGRAKFTEQVLESRAIVIPMPEGSYAGVAKVELCRWTRPRFPWWPLSRARIGTNVDIPKGVPVPGKGENSWDCGPDAIYGRSSPAKTIEDAIGGLVASALRERLRHAGTYEYSERPSRSAEVQR